MKNIYEVQDAVRKYLYKTYDMLGMQKYENNHFKDYFAYNLVGNYTFVKEELYLTEMIERYARQGDWLKFNKPHLQLEWRSIEGYKNYCEVRVVIHATFQFRGIVVPTYFKNIEHQFRLVKEGREWKIEEHHYPEEKVIEGIKERWSMKQNRSEPSPRGTYNREKATDYAKKYALTPNLKEWKSYEMVGGDCTNFVSQCLYAGDIPFDHQGRFVTEKWYWYSEHYRTPSWTSADAFKNYMLGNKGFGLVASLGSLQTVQKGDVIQLGDLTETTHSMLVIEVIKDETRPEMTKDVLVAQHSGINGIRGYNIPLSTKPDARVYYNILGYNP